MNDPGPGHPRSNRPHPPTGLRRTDKSRPVIKLQLTGQVPAHPLSDDNLTDVPSWCLGGNDRFGTCGPTMVANSAIQAWHYLLGEDIRVADVDVFDLYIRAGNPAIDPATGQGDGGIEMSTMLAEVVRNGIRITHADNRNEMVRPLAFASVDVSDVESLHALTAIFGGAALAVDLDDAQDPQTAAGLWDYKPSPAWGGHAILGGAYTGLKGAHQRDVSLVTWAQVVGTTPSFISHQLSECYTIIWPALWDHSAFAAGVDRAELVADYEILTGRKFPLPVPLPPAPPEPEPASVMDAVDLALADAVLRNGKTIRDWSLARHTGSNADAADALWHWGHRKGRW